MTRTVQFQPAFDKRPKQAGDPDYGIHGVTLRFLLQGDLGVIQFVIYTNWQLPHVTEEMKRKRERGDWAYLSRPISDTTLQNRCTTDSLQWTTVMCYRAASATTTVLVCQAEGVFKILLEGGSDAVWLRLEDEYKRRFETIESIA